jgi:hypothetical protein
MRQRSSRMTAWSGLALTVVAGCQGLMPATDVQGGTAGGAKPGSTAITRQTHTFFPIATGVHGNADCNSCHGGLATFTEFTCVTCHQHAQPVTDTLHAAIKDYRYDSKACVNCHPQGVAATISRPDHGKFFPIAAGTPHEIGQCSDCHTTVGDRTQFSCLGCHEHARPVTDLGHAGITGYQYDPKACLSCHQQGVAGSLARSDHGKFFPIDTNTSHATSQCADCHSTKGDRSQFTCLSCHDHAQPVTDVKHVNVPGYRYESASCLRCHAGGKAGVDHATLGPMPNCIGCHRDKLALAVTTPASRHTDNNFPPTCESCHASFTAWGPGTPMRHQAVGNTTARCESCHLTTFTAAVSPFDHVKQGVTASNCNTCHTDFTTWLKFFHPSNCFNGATGRGHQGARCAQCHTVAGNYKQSSCTACHSNRGTNCND